jgi:hypothetical protein
MGAAEDDHFRPCLQILILPWRVVIMILHVLQCHIISVMTRNVAVNSLGYGFLCFIFLTGIELYDLGVWGLLKKKTQLNTIYIYI